MRKATKRQVKYAVALMSQHFGGLRKTILESEYNVTSTKDLTFEQADLIISKLNPDGYDEEFKQRLLRKGMEEAGQLSLGV